MNRQRAGPSAGAGSGAAVPASYLERIRRTFPDRPLERLALIDDGEVNDVVLVDGELACRFAKREVAGEHIEREAHTLALLQPYLSLAVPRFSNVAPGFCTYRWLEGEPLTRERLLALPGAARRAVLEQLAELLRELRRVPATVVAELTVSPTVHQRAWWLARRSTIVAGLAPHLRSSQRRWLERWFAPVAPGGLPFPPPSGPVHGDLAPEHLLFDPARSRLVGVIDFEAGGLGDPAVDLAGLLAAYGAPTLRPTLSRDPALAELAPRACFQAGILQLKRALGAFQEGDGKRAIAFLEAVRELEVQG